MVQGYRIGVIAPHLDGEYYGRLLPHIHRAVKERHSQLFAVQVADDYLGITAIGEPIAFDLVDAWILILPSASASFLEYLGNSDKPFLCIGFQSPHPNGYSILVDNRPSAREEALHLIDVHGHERIAFIGNLDQYDLRKRYEGYREALEERGLPFDEGLVANAEDNLLEGGAKAAERLWSSGREFTAIVAGTDLNALGAIDCLQGKGVRIPQDVAIAGFDDIYQAAVNYPPLTTVRQPFREIAEEAVRRAFELLEGRRTEARESFVYAEPIIRSSCGCSERTVYRTAEEFERYLFELSQLRSSLHAISLNNYQMTKGLINATKDEKVNISKLFWNSTHWGCLALWEEDDRGRRQLVVRQAFSKKGEPVPPMGARYKAFPRCASCRKGRVRRGRTW